MQFVQMTDLPLSLCSTVVIEKRHDLNKGTLLGVVIRPPIVAAIIWNVQKPKQLADIWHKKNQADYYYLDECCKESAMYWLKSELAPKMERKICSIFPVVCVECGGFRLKVTSDN
ncbi:CAAX prenyl protease 1 [Artemisia annua]|uniref:CAAX prenyl protease 1 n=1 Tax=Artemisia annua TaxID=35608 RepID=A0A2U1MNB1_ARTAN|nr:CAAX prenyl protease 1 [Artemisia annua]